VAPFYDLEEGYLVAQSGAGIGPLLKNEYEEIEDFVRLVSLGENFFFRYKDQKFYDDFVYFADSGYFNFFQSNFIEGSADSCFNNPQSIVLTESLAKKVFGDERAMGKIIRTNNNFFAVTGIIEDHPQNTHLQFNALLPGFMDSIPLDEMKRSLWSTTMFNYIKLKEGAEPESVVSNFDRFYEKYMMEMGELLGASFDIKLERLDKIHLYSDAAYDLTRGNIRYLFTFGGIGFMILLLAMINYINMATARAPARMREAGIRKVVGSDKKMLVFQYVGESLLLAFLSILLALSIAEIVVNTNLFQELAQKDLTSELFTSKYVLIGAPVLAILVGILSGLYPALQISKVDSLDGILGVVELKKKRTILRSLLVGFQITMSVSVVVVAITMANQIQFVNSKYLGFNKEEVILIQIQDSVMAHNFIEQKPLLLAHEDILSISTSLNIPGSHVGRSLVAFDEQGLNTEVVDFMVVGRDYFKTLQIPIAQGRAFADEDSLLDGQPVLVNKRFMEVMEWESLEDKKLYWAMDEYGPTESGDVIGVTDDFHAFSLHEQINPLIFYAEPYPDGSINIRVNRENIDDVESFLRRQWEVIDPNHPLEYYYLEDDLGNLYSEDKRLAQLTRALTYLAIFISSLGLLGLASFITERRTKEFGVRLVLGASQSQIIGLVIRQISILVIISGLISIPIARYVLNLWLDNFAYTAPVDPGIFLATILFTLLLAYITVAYHVIYAAKTNPIEVLKYE
ncbi:MAG: ABC transporter permease, partial [Schleiferiaceae bacterium]|nr:ABC transporter permease [Schleiferiaceae bacterium]